MLETIKIKFAKYLHQKLQEHIKNRPPDFTVGKAYLKRWWILPRNKFLNIYYHNFKMSDDPRWLHDHEYINLSFLLEGEYLEHLESGIHHRKTGNFIIRLPSTLHRIELLQKNGKPQETWTLFITAPRVRKWGFMVNNQWLDHETFLKLYGEYIHI